MSVDVFVTGMGIISGLGYGVSETTDSLLSQRTAIKKPRYLKTAHDQLPVSEVRFSDEEMKKILGIEEEKITTRAVLMAIMALKEAIEDSKIEIGGAYRVAFISGTTVGGMDKSEQHYLDFFADDSKIEYMSSHDCGTCTEKVADYFGGFSMITTISTACSSAANSIILGSNLIKAGIVDAAIVGGSECLTKFHLNGFNTLMILDKNVCSPFDENRAGLNLGEGAAYVVLESENLVKKRNARAICKVAGYGNACDAYHQTASSPEGKGALIAMQKALKSSGLLKTDIDYINAHGTGTSNNDSSEGNAISALFDDVGIPVISSTKSYTGHTTSAAGAVEAVISIIAMNRGFMPPNLNYRNKMNDSKVVPIDSLIRDVDMKYVLSNSFGFGGNNSSIIFAKL